MFRRKRFHKIAIPKVILKPHANTTIPCWASIGAGNIRQMSLALETVCAKLNLTLTDDPATRLVASKIIELAQRGVRDAATLTEMTLKEFKH
jgi:hypothetical protein